MRIMPLHINNLQIQQVRLNNNFQTVQISNQPSFGGKPCKQTVLTLLASCLTVGVLATNSFANNNSGRYADSFELSTEVLQSPSNDLKKGSRSKVLLKNAPSPVIVIAGKKVNARIVIDISTNRLYKYNELGKAEVVYSVATGKSSTPTKTGIRKVSDIEDYPYATAYGTKRKKNPKDYGPHVIRLDYVNTQTGKIYGNNGQFLHGNKNASTIGMYVSKGCIRMDNEVIKQMAKELQKGDYVLITRTK